MQTTDQKILIGTVINVHGVRGSVKIKTLSNDPSYLSQIKNFYDHKGQLLPHLNFISRNSDVWIASIENINDRDQAIKLKGLEIYALKQDLPVLSNNHYYHCDLLGCKIIDLTGKEIGTVKNIHNFGAGDIIEFLLLTANKDFMLPLSQTYVKHIDISAKTIVLDLPSNLQTDGEENE